MIPNQIDLGCRCGHKEHDTLRIDIDLNGEHYGITDIPYIVKRLATKIKLEVFNWKRYANSPDYCPADDAFAVSVFRNGVWEGFETALFLDILSKKNGGKVLDYGANVGWYTILAGLKGYDVAAFECDPDIRKLLDRNCKLNNVALNLCIDPIDETTPTLEPTEDIYFVKADIEGNEQYVFQHLKKYFEQKKIDYALLEISPCFNDSYPKLVQDIMSCGYRAYQIPDKTCKFLKEYSEQPLETLKKHYELTGDLDFYINTLRQENFIFIKN